MKYVIFGAVLPIVVCHHWYMNINVFQCRLLDFTQCYCRFYGKRLGKFHMQMSTRAKISLVWSKRERGQSFASLIWVDCYAFAVLYMISHRKYVVANFFFENSQGKDAGPPFPLNILHLIHSPLFGTPCLALLLLTHLANTLNSMYEIVAIKPFAEFENWTNNRYR